ncbi:outer membrane beta-barrel protein [Candidatus Aminicenantes bacterium AC-708-M15]|nr:outer membrane beta-barrel protein [SCandidatus Aminicenantes bacterium Aminicenantia_JdfR_composite]MCP2597507.1 outer membrane beta-barrel protein [Candidatus Aminicenantes bacterium AC-335-G13]MCP2604321.1 outer membrane beta-barrel protein [Candidatus Aminicenantes bacterium AC-708-M15]
MKFKKLGLLLIFFVFILTFTIHAENLKIKVIVEKANIRLKPDLGSPIVGKADLNQVFEVVEETNTKEGKWYMIRFKSVEGYMIYGYIHSSVVKVLEAKKPEEKKPPAPPPAPKPPSPPTPPVSVQKTQPSFKRFFIRAGAGYGSKTYSYENKWEFQEYYETGNVSESYEIDSSGLLVEGGLGFYFTRNIGMELSFNPATGKTKGTFSADFPHPFYFNQHREKNWTKEDLKYSAQELNLNLIFNFQLQRNLSFYISAGGTYFASVKIENLKSISWSEIKYPYDDVNITPQYGEYSGSSFGFNAGGGLDFFIMENMGVNINFRYSSGSVKIDVEGTEVNIKTGGIRGTAGLKFAF